MKNKKELILLSRYPMKSSIIKKPVNTFSKKQKQGEQFLKNIKKRLPELKKLQEKMNGMWFVEDHVYRFYHQSYKVYYIQGLTHEIVDALLKLAPKGCILNEWFDQIVKEGSGKKFSWKHNESWLKHTRPMVEAFFHAKYFLDMACKYGKELRKAPETLPSGWALALYLFNLR